MDKQQIYAQHANNLDKEQIQLLKEKDELDAKIADLEVLADENGLPNPGRLERLKQQRAVIIKRLEQEGIEQKQLYHDYKVELKKLDQQAKSKLEKIVAYFENKPDYTHQQVESFVQRHRELKKEDVVNALQAFRIKSGCFDQLQLLLKHKIEEAKRIKAGASAHSTAIISRRHSYAELLKEIESVSQRMDEFQQQNIESYRIVNSFYKELNLARDCSACKITDQDIAIYQRLQSLQTHDQDYPHDDETKVTKVLMRNKGCGIRFVYADKPSEPVRYGTLIHWLYDLRDDAKLAGASNSNTMAGYTSLQVCRTDHGGYVRGGESSIIGDRQYYVDLEKQQLSVKPRLDHDFLSKVDTMAREAPNISQAYWKAMAKKDPDSSQDFNSSSPVFRPAKPGLQPLTLSIENQIMADIISYGLGANNLSKTLDQFSEVANVSEEDKHTKTEIKQYSETFRRNRTYGFLCYPVDRGPLVTKPVNELTDMVTPEHTGLRVENIAWKGKPESLISDKQKVTKGDDGYPIVTIKIHCTLPEWDRRICLAIDELAELQKQQQEILQPYLAQQGNLIKMVELSKMHYIFRNQTTPESDAHLVKTHQAISELAKFTKKQIDFLGVETNISSKLEKINRAIRAKAEYLYELLCSVAFQAELKSYLDEIECQMNKACGPYMESEPFWIHIFDTIAKAYGVLAATHIGDTIGEKEIPIILNGIAGHSLSEPLLEEQHYKRPYDTYKEQLDHYDYRGKKYKSGITPYDKRVIKAQSKDGKSWRDSFESAQEAQAGQIGPLSTMLNYEAIWDIKNYYQENLKSTLNTYVNNIPGPPPVLMVVLDTYAYFVGKRLKKISNKSNNFHIRALISVMNLAGIFKTQEGKINTRRVQAIHLTMFMRQRKHGEQAVMSALFGKTEGSFSSNLSDNIQASIHGKIYRGTLTFLNLAIAIEDFTNLACSDAYEEYKKKGNEAEFWYDFAMKSMSVVDATGKAVTYGAKLSTRFNNLLNSKGISTKITGALNVFALIGCIESTVNATVALANYLESNPVFPDHDSTLTTFMLASDLVGQFAYTVGFLISDILPMMGINCIPGVGQFLFIIGTITVLVKFAYDHWDEWFDANSYQIIKARWETVKQSEAFRQLIGVQYESNAPDIQGEKDARGLALEVDQLVKDDSHWNTFNWRAVIPLKLSGYTEDQIQDCVFIHGSAPYKNHHMHPMNTRKIIEYYTQLKELVKKEPSAQFSSGRTFTDVIDLLETGTFEPSRHHPEDLDGQRCTWAYEEFLRPIH
ncbi:hypothetical protein [Zooshikella harenae]|uniref:Uncharacterized protein n=1 Tax=Zooshikella harenae TaxID=2827238 RepID=A0ABS5Z722_9GAMM|nr:hypothetical protein [Zooshikella harenae]MBU2709851.1 hypothetical protein [Zooshikella harenae]